MRVSEILEKALALMGDGRAWHGGSNSPADGGVCLTTSVDRAVRAALAFPESGPLDTVEDCSRWCRMFNPAVDLIRAAITGVVSEGGLCSPIWRFNDAPDRKWPDAKGVLVHAIDAARKAEGVEAEALPVAVAEAGVKEECR